MKLGLIAPLAVLVALGGCQDAPASQRLAVNLAQPVAAARPAADADEPDDPGSPIEPDEPDVPEVPDDPPDDPTPPDDPDPPDDPGSVDPPPVDPGVVVVDAFPFVDSWDTTAGDSVIDAYACAPGTPESGPEIVYRVTVPEAGLLAATLDGLPDGVDVDVHILAGDGPDSCLDRGHWDAAAFLTAGTHTVVVDSWANAAGTAFPGAYTLTLGFTPAAGFEAAGLDSDVLRTGLQVFASAWRAGDTDRLEYTVIDFSLHSVHPRLFTFDLRDGALLFAERVCHGEGSAVPGDTGWADRFSNVEGSHQSSLGLMRSASRYQSTSNGLSLRLDGLEDGVNDLVRSRAIVIHSDSYATPGFVATYGRMGTSWGCQVIDPARIDAFVDTVEGGSLVWSWYPDDAFVATSGYLAEVAVPAGL